MSHNSSDLAWDYPSPFVIEAEASSDDIDGYGHVNNTVYLTWMDRCAFEHADAVGINVEVCRSLNRGMAAVRHEIDYLASAYEGDRVLIGDWITFNDGRLRAQRRFQIIRVADGRTLVRCVSNYVCTDLVRGKPAKMPQSFLDHYVVLPEVAKSISTS